MLGVASYIGMTLLGLYLMWTQALEKIIINMFNLQQQADLNK